MKMVSCLRCGNYVQDHNAIDVFFCSENCSKLFNKNGKSTSRKVKREVYKGQIYKDSLFSKKEGVEE